MWHYAYGYIIHIIFMSSYNFFPFSYLDAFEWAFECIVLLWLVEQVCLFSLGDNLGDAWKWVLERPGIH